MTAMLELTKAKGILKKSLIITNYGIGIIPDTPIHAFSHVFATGRKLFHSISTCTLVSGPQIFLESGKKLQTTS